MRPELGDYLLGERLFGLPRLLFGDARPGNTNLEG